MSLIGNKPQEYPSDMVDLNVWYAITINPDNKHQYIEYKRDRLEYVYAYLLNYHMLKLSDYSDYILYPEISTPKEDNKRGITRIHYHGKIRFTKTEGIFIWYMYVLNNLKSISVVKFDTIANAKTWENYIAKNKQQMIMLCKFAKVPYYMTDECKRYNRVDNIIKGTETIHPVNFKNDCIDEEEVDE